jgi:crossover junction endodeoxyribonuclease RusA
VIRYEFPWPPRELSPNVSVHWRTLGKAKREYKEDCIKMFWTLGPPPLPGQHLQPPVAAQVTFVVPDRYRRDSDNHMAMLKPLWDAIVRWGILKDDSHDKLKILDPKWERGEKKIVVELEGSVV